MPILQYYSRWSADINYAKWLVECYQRSWLEPKFIDLAARWVGGQVLPQLPSIRSKWCLGISWDEVENGEQCCVNVEYRIAIPVQLSSERRDWMVALMLKISSWEIYRPQLVISVKV